MAIYNILADGRQAQTLDGHVLRYTDAETVYKTIAQILNKERRNNDGKKDHKSDNMGGGLASCVINSRS